MLCHTVNSLKCGTHVNRFENSVPASEKIIDLTYFCPANVLCKYDCVTVCTSLCVVSITSH
jgi:hypothetical protein